MNEDQVVGSAKNLGGRVQEGFGRVTGDAKSQIAGALNQTAGAAQEFYGNAKETASDAAGAVLDGAASTEDFVRRVIEERPYTTAIVALCLGLVIGRMSNRD